MNFKRMMYCLKDLRLFFFTTAREMNIKVKVNLIIVDLFWHIIRGVGDPGKVAKILST